MYKSLSGACDPMIKTAQELGLNRIASIFSNEKDDCVMPANHTEVFGLFLFLIKYKIIQKVML